ncbi:SGNH/GDSL hydrolase family protein [Agrococcus sp. SGAir0287]|uniref:SGNH/GDSL hydrolase family protein n=1 Tax=Agrococcus sp. SGAir0287 TaxID=2070347 RepID=UPI0010CD5A12|nr:SGNH/GDSL hydrolase family protein [Agrococcus sp. SGAir0287]QCR20086.1 hypothetical protein C1N71_12080 [Agrococcus sp. SGAir0287]
MAPAHLRRATPSRSRCRIHAAALAVVGAGLVACSQTPSTTAPGASEGATDVVRMAVVGDSITDADSPDLASGALGAQSWVSYAVGDGVAFAGGWAQWGARTAQMADGVAGPLDADVLVILAGTNDAYSDDLAADVGAQLERIVDRADVEAVVVSSIPPIDAAPDRATAVNAFLEPFVAEHGWTWVDASAGLRDGEGFAPTMSDDGVHPTADGARILGHAIREAVLAAD